MKSFNKKIGVDETITKRYYSYIYKYAEKDKKYICVELLDISKYYVINLVYIILKIQTTDNQKLLNLYELK